MKKLVLILLVILLVNSGITLFGCSKETSTTTATATTTVAPKTLKIGLLTDLTGFLSVFFIADAKHAEVMADIINEKGGITIQGQKYNIQLVEEDSKSSADGAVAAANKLIFDDQVKFVIGGLAFELPPIAPIFTQNKVFHITGYNSLNPDEVNSNTPYSFVGVNSAAQCMAIYAYAFKKEFPNAKTVGLIFADDGSAPFMIPVIKKMLASQGITIVNENNPILYPNDMTDFSPIAAKANAIKADGIMQISGVTTAVASILKGIRDLGNMVPYGALTGIPDLSVVLEVVGLAGSTNFLDVSTIGKHPNNPPLYAELLARAPGVDAFTTAATDLDVLIKIIQKANSLDPDVVKATWESTDSVDSVTGKVLFCGDETFGLKHHALSAPYPYQMLMNGEIIIPEYPWIGPEAIP
jgi:branched-chain amino acid transport system substrate-binding protein